MLVASIEKGMELAVGSAERKDPDAGTDVDSLEDHLSSPVARSFA